MANPADPGTLDLWLTAAQPFGVLSPKTGSTGEFDLWLSARVVWPVYVEQRPKDLGGGDIAAGVPTVSVPELAQVHGLGGGEITAGLPTLTAPGLGQGHALGGGGLAAGAATLSAALLGQVHGLGGGGVAAGLPVLTSAALHSYDPDAAAMPAARTYVVQAESRVYRVLAG